MVSKHGLLGAHWLMLLVTGVLFALVAAFVDLKPVVDEGRDQREEIGRAHV